MLKSFYNSIDTILNNHQELIYQLKSLRDLLKTALAKDGFRLHCIEKILDTMDEWNDKEKSWNAPPIFYHDKLRYSVRIIFWPAFYENNPHQHKTWSVTGIFHNYLNIHTYQMLDHPKRLKKERAIIAAMGEVGYLTPGCIHNVNNITHDLSASIHIFNNISDIDHPEENAVWYPSPRKHNLSAGLMDRALLTCLSIASNIHIQQAFHIIDRIYARSSSSIQLMAIKAMYGFNRAHAKQCFTRLEAVL
ncbi:MAG: hypothetical protein ACD_45C00744G0006 [uncultured bacterium]|nr:MAG: hypothetical protein ACD_45C00744G0006 [uncultured bacterium]